MNPFLTARVISGVEEYLTPPQGLSQALETGCPKLAIVNLLGLENSSRFKDNELLKGDIQLLNKKMYP